MAYLIPLYKLFTIVDFYFKVLGLIVCLLFIGFQWVQLYAHCFVWYYDLLSYIAKVRFYYIAIVVLPLMHKNTYYSLLTLKTTYKYLPLHFCVHIFYNKLLDY